MVVVNPGTVMGPVIPPRLNASMLMLVRLLQGNALSMQYALLAYIVVAIKNVFSGNVNVTLRIRWNFNQ